MDGGNIFRRLRGAVGNAVVWGAGWFAATLAVSAAFGIARGSFDWTAAWQMAARTGLMGGIASTVFSGVIGLLYSGRRLSEISWLRFGIGGGIVAGVVVPTVMFVGRTINGDGPLAMENWISSTIVAAVFGGIAAGASLKLAQRASTMLPRGKQEERDRLKGLDPLASMGERDIGRPEVPARPTTED